MKTIVAFLLLAGAHAYCPDQCSGHGQCGAHDSCVCYRNWQGVACSERTCPYGVSWTEVTANPDNSYRHTYTECSSKGSCDRKNGVCECVEGYEGKGCSRMSCNEGCSGHGTCERISSKDSGAYATYAASNDDHVWDSNKIQYCKCDPGWSGDDCNSRKCKPGNDPLTEWAAADQTSEVQEVQVWYADDAGNTLGGQFLLTYTDWRDETWTTWPINAATFSATTIKEALMGLPNAAIPDISVGAVSEFTTASGAPAAGTGQFYKKVAVTFDSRDTSGNQPTLGVMYSGCSTAGCQPYYTALTETSTSQNINQHLGGSGTTAATPFVYVSTTVAADTENTECSARGTCQSDSGLCKCFQGYYGESCDRQTIIQ